MKTYTKLLLIGTLVITAGIFVAGNVWAFSIEYGVDFRDDAWNGADGQHEYTVGNVTATAKWGDRNLYQDNEDGLGIRTNETDEVDQMEKLWIEFDGGMELTGVWITDLFEAPDGHPENGEWGKVRLHAKDEDGGLGTTLGTYEFWGNDADQDNGELYVDFGGVVNADFAVFLAENKTHEFENNEFSVGGFTATPEPATMVLLGLGLVGLAGLKRKLAHKS